MHTFGNSPNSIKRRLSFLLQLHHPPYQSSPHITRAPFSPKQSFILSKPSSIFSKQSSTFSKPFITKTKPTTMVSKFLTLLSTLLLTTGTVVNSYALPRANPADIITASSSSATPTPTAPSQSTITSTAICLTETQNGIVSTRWITATYWAPIPTSFSFITGSGSGSATIVTPSKTTTWRPPTNTATTRDPWCTIKVPAGAGGAGAVMKRVLPKEEAVRVVREELAKREARPGSFEADTSYKALGQADMLYCPG